MRHLILAAAIALVSLCSLSSPSHAADELKNVASGDTYTLQVWDVDDSEYKPAFVCVSGDQPLCDMPNNAVMRYNGSTMEEVFGQFALSHHEHPMTDIDGLLAALTAKQAAITAGAKINDAATNAASNAATNAQTNGSAGAVTNLATDYNLVSGLLGVANGLNSANSAQNDLAVKYNALVGKYNEAAGKLNDNATKYNALASAHNDLAVKFNTLVDHLETQGIQTP